MRFTCGKTSKAWFDALSPEARRAHALVVVIAVRPCVASTLGAGFADPRDNGRERDHSTRARVIVDQALSLAAKGSQSLRRVSPMQHRFERVVFPVEGMAFLVIFAPALLSYPGKHHAPMGHSALDLPIFRGSRHCRLLRPPKPWSAYGCIQALTLRKVKFPAPSLEYTRSFYFILPTANFRVRRHSA